MYKWLLKIEFFLTEKIFTANIFFKKKILLAVLPIASFALEERHYLNRQPNEYSPKGRVTC